jgi:hypothetical protein
VEYWPTAEGELVAKPVNSTPKVVFSSTLDREPGRDMMVWGSISLARSLRGQDLTLLEAEPYASGIVSLRYAVPHP